MLHISDACHLRGRVKRAVGRCLLRRDLDDFREVECHESTGTHLRRNSALDISEVEGGYCKLLGIFENESVACHEMVGEFIGY
jgi:hypothetical protein